MLQYLQDLWTSYYDPWYWYILVGIVVIACAIATAWFFSVLRPVAGAVFFGVIAFLTGFRKGQHIERERQSARERDVDRKWW